MTREERSLAEAQKTVCTETVYLLPQHGVAIEDGYYAGDRVRPTHVKVTTYPEDPELSPNVSVTGYKVKKDGTRHANGAAWHSVSLAAQERYERALGFVRVPKRGYSVEPVE